MALVATLQSGERVLHAQRLRVAQRGQSVGGQPLWLMVTTRRARVGHAGAVAVFAGHFHLGGMPAMSSSQYFGGAAA